MSGIDLGELAVQAHALAKEKGFWDGALGLGESFVPEKLCLIHEEVSEALAAYRVGDMHTFFHCKCTPSARFVVSGFSSVSQPARGLGARDCPACREPLKPDGFPVELGDIIIRVADLAERLGVDLSAVIRSKHAYNSTRPRKHGKVC